MAQEAFGELLGGAGIGNEHTVVLYGDRNNWFAAYTYWYLKYYGHENVKLMNGPREKWISEGRPTTSTVPEFEPVDYRAAAGDEAIRAKRDDVMAALDAQTRLVDVRSPGEFCGELALRPGLRARGRDAHRSHPGRRHRAVGHRGRRGRDLQERGRAPRDLQRRPWRAPT